MVINLSMQAVFILNQSVFILKNINQLMKLEDGATVIMSNSVPDHGRVLTLFEKEGLIKLKDGIDKANQQL